MKVILALYPNARGLSYACIMMPTRVIDCGTANPLPFSKGRFLKRVEKFIDFYQPTVVTLRGVEGDVMPSRKAGQLLSAIAKLAEGRNLPVHSYTRKQVKDVFEIHGARTKHEISQKIIEWLPDLSVFAPTARKLWLPEDHRMGIFDAVSLAIAHDYLED